MIIANWKILATADDGWSGNSKVMAESVDLARAKAKTLNQ